MTAKETNTETLVYPDRFGPQATYVTYTWRRDVLSAARQQRSPYLQNPFKLLNTQIADSFSGYWQLSCGDPPLIFSPKYLRAAKVVRAYEKLQQRRLRQGVAPDKEHELLAEIQLAQDVATCFEIVADLNSGVES